MLRELGIKPGKALPVALVESAIEDPSAHAAAPGGGLLHAVRA